MNSKDDSPKFLAARSTWSKNPCEENASSKRSTGTAHLPSEKAARRLEDIIENAQAILRYTAGMDLDAFKDDRRTYDAVERCLERISEGAAKPPS